MFSCVGTCDDVFGHFGSRLVDSNVGKERFRSKPRRTFDSYRFAALFICLLCRYLENTT